MHAISAILGDHGPQQARRCGQTMLAVSVDGRELCDLDVPPWRYRVYRTAGGVRELTEKLGDCPSQGMQKDHL